jgi:hypothetical protein
MKTLEKLYCEANKCTAADFSRQVFWKCLYRHAVPLVPLIRVISPGYFDGDRQLIADVSRADKMNQVWEAVREYFIDPRYKGWARRKGNIRVSARRLISLSREYLPASGSPPPPYPPATS